MDRVSKEVRSRIMSSIRGKDTKPELALRHELYMRGFRYRKDYMVGNTRADIAFVRKRIAVFVDGCFWHGCPSCYKVPKSNRGYWIPKIRGNMERDRESSRRLKESGWKVIRVWEHEIGPETGRVSDRIIRAIDR